MEESADGGGRVTLGFLALHHLAPRWLTPSPLETNQPWDRDVREQRAFITPTWRLGTWPIALRLARAGPSQSMHFLCSFLFHFRMLRRPHHTSFESNLLVCSPSYSLHDDTRHFDPSLHSHRLFPSFSLPPLHLRSSLSRYPHSTPPFVPNLSTRGDTTPWGQVSRRSHSFSSSPPFPSTRTHSRPSPLSCGMRCSLKLGRSGLCS